MLYLLLIPLYRSARTLGHFFFNASNTYFEKLQANNVEYCYIPAYGVYEFQNLLK